MKHLVLFLLLVSAAASADEVSGNVAVLNATPTRVPPASLLCPTCKTLRIENGGPNPIYCGPDAAVTADTGVFTVPGNEGWVSVPHRPNIYCVAGTADQTGVGRNRTYVWAVFD